MYFHIGQNVLLKKSGVIGVFDLDNTTWSKRTRDFLDRAQREGRVESLGEDLPKAFVLCEDKIYLTQLTSAALRGRWERKESS